MKGTIFSFCFGVAFLITGIATAGTIHGFVREKKTKEPIIMANVWIKGTNTGTTTNMKGYYVLSSLEPGTYEFHFRYIGYTTLRIEKYIGRDDDIELDVYLEIEAIMMEEAVVTAERERRELEIKPGQITVQIPQLRSIPQIAEPDLFRAIQMLPGVATLSDFSAGLYVRGGSPDQNLILLDHIDVYNPNHMFGFFSSFNTDAIKSVELLKGGFPAMYGGRLSSVLNVINKEGNREQFQGVARLSLLSSNATLEGPWKYGSWMISGRRTYL
ncbi:MAG TPA: carboxypeptidase-like regulatory domain-containing protein, partial [bacterium]